MKKIIDTEFLKRVKEVQDYMDDAIAFTSGKITRKQFETKKKLYGKKFVRLLSMSFYISKKNKKCCKVIMQDIESGKTYQSFLNVNTIFYTKFLSTFNLLRNIDEIQCKGSLEFDECEEIHGYIDLENYNGYYSYQVNFDYARGC